MFKKDTIGFGVALGFLAPFAGLLIYYLVQFRMFTIAEFIKVILSQKALLSGIVSICLIANAIVFTYYINTHKDRTARGIFIATCIYAITALLYKLLA